MYFFNLPNARAEWGRLSTSFCVSNVTPLLVWPVSVAVVKPAGKLQLVGDEDVGLERELVPLDLPGDVGDRRDAVELDRRRIDLRHGEARGPEDRDPHQVAMTGVDDPVFMGVDQDRRRRLGVDAGGHRHGGLGEREGVLGEVRVADVAVESLPANAPIPITLDGVSAWPVSAR